MGGLAAPFFAYVVTMVCVCVCVCVCVVCGVCVCVIGLLSKCVQNVCMYVTHACVYTLFPSQEGNSLETDHGDA